MFEGIAGFIWIVAMGVVAGMSFIGGLMLASTIASTSQEKKDRAKYEAETLRLLSERNEIDREKAASLEGIHKAIAYQAYF